MAPANQTESLKEKKSKLWHQIQDIKILVKERDEKRFADAGGCNTCCGRGWIVVWDTLDSMSGCYAEYDDCPEENCTNETRELSGLLPRNSKYDRNRASAWYPNYTEAEMTKTRELQKKIELLERDISLENSRWTPDKGKLAEVVKSGRGRKDRRVPVGTKGIILGRFTNNWGTEKVIILDEHGQKHYPVTNNVEVIDPKPSDSKWTKAVETDRKESGYPVVAVVKAKSARAALIRLTNAKEFWVPISQVPALEKSKKAETVSVFLPLWLAKKNGLVK